MDKMIVRIEEDGTKIIGEQNISDGAVEVSDPEETCLLYFKYSDFYEGLVKRLNWEKGGWK